MKRPLVSLICMLTLGVAVTPFFADAAFTSLSPNLPLMGQIGAMSLAEMLKRFFVIAIAFSALLAVIMVAIGGFEYMTTDSVFKMGNAKERITDAIIGLLIVLMAVLLLRTINPCLVTLSILSPGGNTTCTN